MILFYNFHLNFISLICTRSLIWFVLGKVVRSTDFCSNAIRFLAEQISITNPSARRWNITHSAATSETALLSLTDNWLKAMDNSKLVGLVFLDLSKAFDLVSHDILLSKIAKYHTSKQPLRWFRSYLCDRTKTYNISGVLSDPLTLTWGVPQGSILGPVLFSRYINDLPLCLPASEVEMYSSDILEHYGLPITPSIIFSTICKTV